MRVISQSPDPLARMHTMTKRQGKSGTIDVKALLREDEEFLRVLVRTALQEVLEGEMTEALGAEKGERTAGRQGYRWLLRPDADHADWQARAAGATGPRRAVLDRAVRTLPTFGTGAGSSAGGDVCAGCFDAQGEGDHRGTVRPQLFGVLDQRNEPAAGREPGTICRPSVGRSLPLSDPRRTLRAGARGRRDRQPGGIDRDRYRLGRPPPGAGGRARQSREPFQLARFP